MPIALFWIVVTLMAAMLVLLAWLGSRRRRLNPKEIGAFGGPVGCAACGYDVRGLPSSVCPECGCDLDVVGRLTPQFRRWQAVPPLLRALGWSISVFIMGSILGLIGAFGFAPQRHEFRESQYYFFIHKTSDATVLIDRSVTRTLWPVEQGVYPRESLRRLSPERVLVQIQAPAMAKRGATQIMTQWHFDRGSDGEWRLQPHPSVTQQPATPQLMARILAGAGISIPEAEQERSEEEQQLCEAMFVSLDAPVQEARYTSSRQADTMIFDPRAAIVGFGRVKPYWPAISAIIGFWILAWVLGLFFVLRRRPVRQGRPHP